MCALSEKSMSCRTTLSRFAVSFLLLIANGLAQVPAPHPARKPYPGIAPVAPGVTAQAAPLLAIPDGVWNHGEGFSGADSGGWHSNTDGTDVQLQDIHVNPNDVWVSYIWHSDHNNLYPQSGCSMLRMEGYLRPASAPPLPTVHPRYGSVPQGYVDQGAFEMFKPTTAWSGQKILVVIHLQETAPFPLDASGRSLDWRQMYRGYFSIDGLVRNEQPGGLAGFLATDALDDLDVERPLLNTIANWSPGTGYWPIETYAVLSVMHRSTTLNEQRALQLRQAVKQLLQDCSNLNPIGNVLTPSQLEHDVVFVVVGGSNGGMQSSLATLRYPHLLHGSFSQVINPSYERLYAEFDLERALQQLTGTGMGPGEVAEDDFLTWNQYVWSQDLEMHDMSVLRSFISGNTFRPVCFAVGDEDPTSTGVNWAGVINGGSWGAYGNQQSTCPFGLPLWNTFAWTTGQNARHNLSVGPVVNPYTNPTTTTIYSADIAMSTWAQAIGQHAAGAGQAVPVPALTHTPRQGSQDFRGLDDPQEWWLGRPGDPLPIPSPSDPMVLDTTFYDAVNPGATGSMPGGKEAMFVSNGLVYVGSADGFVSSFYVDQSTPKMPLLRFARSPRLGNECFAIGKVSDTTDWIVAGTRRHLFHLDINSLSVVATKTLPYEVAQPHHIVCADVLPGHAGKEIVFASVHGGLCFYDLNLLPIYEWPEPGIIDFVCPEPYKIILLSARGVVATVSFAGPNHAATLEAVSKAIQQNLLTNGATDFPCQGTPHDLELMMGNYGALVPITISSWSGDTDGNTVRAHVPWYGLAQVNTFAPNLPAQVLDIATCKENGISPLGDHALVLLGNGTLQLYDQLGALRGEKDLTNRLPPPANTVRYPFGLQAHHMAVGELMSVGGSGYHEQVVVATNTGLMWMHINELVAVNASELPAVGNSLTGAYVSGFWVEKNGPTQTPQPPPLPDTKVQARTNMTMQCTWAMARRPLGTGLDSYLHVLDQRGIYWRVGYGGDVQVWDWNEATVGARGWGYTGPLSAGPAPLMPANLLLISAGSNELLQTLCYCPKDSLDVVYELTSLFIHDNWVLRPLPDVVFDGFFVYPATGTVVEKPTAWSNGSGSGFEVWHWTAAPAGGVVTGPTAPAIPVAQWGNLVQGVHVGTGGPSAIVDGLWASTFTDPSLANTIGTPANQVPHHRLRSHNLDSLSNNQQAIAAVDLQVPVTGSTSSRQTAVILGCPGGRVRVCLPGLMRASDGSPHALGGFESTDDYGLGVSALAAKHKVSGSTEQVMIWFGTFAAPERRPGAYTNPTGSLGDTEVGSASVHRIVWTPGQGFSQHASIDLLPTSQQPRGAAGVVGMVVADLIPGSPGDELVVGTLSGDLIFYNAELMTEVWRTHIHGSAGCYNSLLAADLNGDTHPELYVAGSSGLWRFVQPGETHP